MYQPVYFCGTWRDLMQRESAVLFGRSRLFTSAIGTPLSRPRRGSNNEMRLNPAGLGNFYRVPDWETSTGLWCPVVIVFETLRFG